jgi:hypothetical protein
LAAVLIPEEPPLDYTIKEIEWAKQEKANQLKGGW